MNRIISIIFFLLIASIPFPVRAYGDCQSAIDQYNSAVEDINSKLKRYVNCISDSKGHDDCSSEFRRLKSDQSDFESAVMNFGMECR